MHSAIRDFMLGHRMKERERIENASENVNQMIYHTQKVIMAGSKICCELLKDSKFQRAQKLVRVQCN